jgi:hypothetical protein
MGQMAANQRTGHPWAGMFDRELVQSAQLFQRDFQTGKKGFSLAAVLLLGDDQVILSVLPRKSPSRLPPKLPSKLPSKSKKLLRFARVQNRLLKSWNYWV